MVCDACGKETFISAPTLEQGKSKSCGCIQYQNRPKGKNSKKFQDLTGQRFGKLVVERYDSDEPSRRTYWICKCDCGNTKSVRALYLKQGDTASCGCQTYRKGKDSPCWTGYEEISGHQWWEIKKGARIRDLHFNLSIQEAWQKFINQEKRCALTGESLEMRRNASLDRIDSSKGYSAENIQWLTKKINVMKWDLPQEEFLALCKKVADFAL